MSEMRCDEVRELAPEVSIDIATGEERDAVLRHASTCSDCRRLVYELSSIGDGVLLALAPVREPGPGFDSRVLASLVSTQPATTERAPRRSWVRLAAAIGAAVVAVFLGAGAVYQATSADRELGAAYRATLELGRGSSFAAAPITGAQGRVGTVFAYQGDPSWVMVTLDTPSEQLLTYTVEVATRGDDYLDLGEAVFDPGDRTWGETLPVDLDEVQGIRLLGSEGGVVFRAIVDAEDPWN